MITALQLVFSPFETWEKITTAQRGFFWILLLDLLPVLIIALGIEGFLLARWGEKRGMLGFMVKVPVEVVVRYCAAYFLILLAAVFISSKFLAMASESFNVHTSYLQAFRVMAYGFGPIILARILDGFPHLNTWVCWAIGTAIAVSILYYGVGMVLRPEQTKGFGLYLICVIIVVLTSALAHFSALAVLHNKNWSWRSAATAAPWNQTVVWHAVAGAGARALV